MLTHSKSFSTEFFPSIKASCHIPFTHAFSALDYVLEVLTLVVIVKVSSSKMQRNVVNSCVNRIGKQGFTLSKEDQTYKITLPRLSLIKGTLNLL